MNTSRRRVDSRCSCRGRRAASSLTLLALALAHTAACRPDPEDLRSQARELQEAGRFAASLEPLAALLEQERHDRDANFLYGLALVRSGRFSEAVWSLREALQDPALAVAAGLLLGEAQFRTGNFEEAERAASGVLQVEPDEIQALVLRAQARLGERREEEALQDAERALALAPDHIDLLFIRAQALLGLRRLDEVEKGLEELRTRVETQDPAGANAARLCATRATFRAEKGELEAAAELFRGCAERFPADPLVVDAVVEFLTASGDREEAIQVLRRAVEESPEQTLFRSALAARLRNAGEREQAERLLLEATEKLPSADTWTALADHYVAVEDYAAARGALERASELLPDPPAPFLFAYGDLLILSGDLAGARQIAAELGPPFSDLLRGRILLEEGDPRAALEALEAGSVRWPNNATARFLAGQAAERLGEVDRAVSEYRESVRSGPERSKAGLRLAQILMAEGAFSEAAPPLAHHIRTHPGDPEGLALAIRMSAQLGMPTERLVQQLARLPGQAGRAVSERAAIVRSRAGPAAAAEVIESSGLDLDEPVHADALEALIGQLAAAGEPERGLARTASAVAAHPDSARLQQLHAVALETAGRPREELQSALERALALQPEHPGALARSARLAAADGDLDSALGLYDRAAASDPENPLFAYEAILLLERAGRSGEAARRARLVLQEDALQARVASALARAEIAQGDLDAALAAARRAVRFGGGAEALEALGWAELERGSAEAAVEALERTLEARDSPSTRYRLARALAATGDLDGARRELRRALDAGSFPERERALADLERFGAGAGAGPL